MTGIYKDKTLDSNSWGYSSALDNIESLPLSLVTRPIGNEACKMANIYNEFVNNDIDFCDSPDYYLMK